MRKHTDLCAMPSACESGRTMKLPGFCCRAAIVSIGVLPALSCCPLCRQRAFQAFSENGVSATQDHTGILIFVSHFERRVIILADRGINTKVPAGTWESVIELLVREMRADNLTGAFTTAIQECGRILSEHFPATKTELNELPDRLVIED